MNENKKKRRGQTLGRTPIAEGRRSAGGRALVEAREFAGSLGLKNRDVAEELISPPAPLPLRVHVLKGAPRPCGVPHKLRGTGQAGVFREGERGRKQGAAGRRRCWDKRDVSLKRMRGMSIV